VTSILVVVAHADDEVLGCGGYIGSRDIFGDKVTIASISDGVTSRDSNFGGT